MADNQDDQSTAVERLQDIRHLLTEAERDIHEGRERDGGNKTIRALRHLEEIVRDLVSGAAG